MRNSFLADLLDRQLNGIIVLNRNKEVVYSNKVIRDKFSSQVNTLLGDYLNCKYTISERVHCQNTSNCKSCVVNNVLDRVLESNNEQVAYDVIFDSGDTKLIFSIKVYAKDEFLILEMFNFNDEDKKLHLLSRLVEKSSDIMFFKDSKLRYRYINDSCIELFGKTKKEIIGKTDSDLLIGEESKQCLKSDLITFEKGIFSSIESINDMHFLISKENIDGGILCIIKNISKELNAIKKSEIDDLTDLYNRRKFTAAIDDAYKHKKHDFYLSLIDLDNLRSINNQFGHAMGDKYLAKVGEILNSYSEGTFFRLGGDEFAGLMQIDKHSVEKLFDNILSEMNQLNLTPPLSLSVGIIKLDIDEIYLHNYEKVDTLLYKAKKEGKNRFIMCN